MKPTTGTIQVDTERCKGCALCVEACPQHCLALSGKAVNKKGYPFAILSHPADCTGCTSCAIVCPDACITVYRAKNPHKA